MKRQVFVSQGKSLTGPGPGQDRSCENHCALEATSRDGRGRSRLPPGGPSSLWGRGLVSTHSLGKQLRNRILNTQIKKKVETF